MIANRPKPTGLFVVLYELTHGLTYLVFKYQLLLFSFDPPWGETTDYTEANFVVKCTLEIF